MLRIFKYDKGVDADLKSIRKLLVASMNGVASTGMKHLGYKLNYGVSLLRIKELSGRFDPSSQLARSLWFSECREMMIMATHLQPADSFPERDALSWLEECKNMELAEQLARNLYVNLSYADALLLRAEIGCASVHVKSFAYILASLLLKREGVRAPFLDAFVARAGIDVYSGSAAVYSGVSRFLKELCRLDADGMRRFAMELDPDKGSGAAWVREEMLTVLDFG